MIFTLLQATTGGIDISPEAAGGIIGALALLIIGTAGIWIRGLATRTVKGMEAAVNARQLAQGNEKRIADLADRLQTQVDTLQTELTKSRGENSNLQGSVKTLTDQQAQTFIIIGTLNQTVSDQGKAIASFTATLAQRDLEIVGLKNTAKELEASITRVESVVTRGEAANVSERPGLKPGDVTDAIAGAAGSVKKETTAPDSAIEVKNMVVNTDTVSISQKDKKE